MTLDIVLCLISLAVGAIFALYSKPMSDWRERKEQTWKMNKAARRELSRERAELFITDQHSYTQFLVDLTYRLVMAFGCMILGMLLIILAFATDLRAHRLETYFSLSIKIFGALVYGFGFSILFQLRSEHTNYLRALREIRKELSGE